MHWLPGDPVHHVGDTCPSYSPLTHIELVYGDIDSTWILNAPQRTGLAPTYQDVMSPYSSLPCYFEK